MSKKTSEKIINVIPDIVKNAASWIKNNFDENGQELLGNATGSAAILIKFFGQQLIDKYFAKLTKDKLADFGSNTYLNAAYQQASDSIDFIKDDLLTDFSDEKILYTFSNIICNKINSFDIDSILLIFQQKYHPLVQYVKNDYENILRELGANTELIRKFKKHFNSNIESTIKSKFGSDYDSHIKDVSSFVYEETEAKLLSDTFKLAKIGFDINENLTYEPTYGNWRPISELNSFSKKNTLDDKFDIDELNENEKKLKLVEDLIAEYFEDNTDNIDKILFLIAGFGKGKSVFMRYYASKLAKEYTEIQEGCFPIYFNLREYKLYKFSSRLGVIADFLLTKYGFNIEKEPHLSRKYIFLIDSLDESGELNKASIEDVVASVRLIQNIDLERRRNNKIIITSRPISDGLDSLIRQYNPFQIEEDDRTIDNYISIYGFKKEQFNNWITITIKESLNKSNVEKSTISLVKRIYEGIQSDSLVDVYQELIGKTLKYSELKRPIFAYMIYQLIINDINFEKIGKIGVYLSFLNLLTKDAKHIQDKNYKINFKEEFACRNILHATAALWMYRRHKGEGDLKKVDLCKVIDNNNSKNSDETILNDRRNENIINIEFLSHSYFGEKSNTLHFQHQSFAEILLAEYYLKIFIKYALEKSNPSIDEVAAKLHLGQPTNQTISFFIELLTLLKESVAINQKNKDEIIEKRRLLFPLLASLATQQNNTLYSPDLYYTWFNKFEDELQNSKRDYPNVALEDWVINNEAVEKIVELASKLLNNDKIYLLTRGQRFTSLYDNEIYQVEDKDETSVSRYFDKWISLIVGDNLYTDISVPNQPILFNTDFKINYRVLFALIHTCKYENRESWMNPLFKGIDMQDNNSRFGYIEVYNGIDFSFSYFNNLSLEGCYLVRNNFSNCYFKTVDFRDCLIWKSDFSNLKGLLDCRLASIRIYGVLINIFKENNIFLKKDKSKKVIFINYKYVESFLEDFVIMLKNLTPFMTELISDYTTLKDSIQLIPTKLNSILWELYDLKSNTQIVVYLEKHKKEINSFYDEL